MQTYFKSTPFTLVFITTLIGYPHLQMREKVYEGDYLPNISQPVMAEAELELQRSDSRARSAILQRKDSWYPSLQHFSLRGLLDRKSRERHRSPSIRESPCTMVGSKGKRRQRRFLPGVVFRCVRWEPHLRSPRGGRHSEIQRS